MRENSESFINAFKNGCLYAISGRPGMGKTTVALFVANAFKNNGKKVLYIKTCCIQYGQNDTVGCDFLYQPCICANEIENLVSIGKYEVIILDSFQELIKESKTKNAMSLKRIAKKYNALIVVVSNISRKADRRRNHKPKISDMTAKLCGSLAMNCRAVILLYRKRYYDEIEESDIIEASVASGLFGKTRVFKLDFDKMIKRIYVK